MTVATAKRLYVPVTDKENPPKAEDYEVQVVQDDSSQASGPFEMLNYEPEKKQEEISSLAAEPSVLDVDQLAKKFNEFNNPSEQVKADSVEPDNKNQELQPVSQNDDQVLLSSPEIQDQVQLSSDLIQPEIQEQVQSDLIQPENQAQPDDQVQQQTEITQQAINNLDGLIIGDAVDEPHYGVENQYQEPQESDAIFERQENINVVTMADDVLANSLNQNNFISSESIVKDLLAQPNLDVFSPFNAFVQITPKKNQIIADVIENNNLVFAIQGQKHGQKIDPNMAFLQVNN